MSAAPWENGRPADEPEPVWDGLDYAVAAGDLSMLGVTGPDPDLMLIHSGWTHAEAALALRAHKRYQNGSAEA